MAFRYIRRTTYFLLLFTVVCLFAQTMPNFSGIWKMDPELSDFGPQTVPSSAEYVIRHVGGKISFNYTQDGSTSRVDLIPDNEERITSSTEDTATWTRTHWSGPVLVIEARERRKFGVLATTGASWTSRWSLSADGKQLIIERTIRNNIYDMKQRVVFVKQPLTKQNGANATSTTSQ
jgi:hypothetical protein